jgi:hypothetical protein
MPAINTSRARLATTMIRTGLPWSTHTPATSPSSATGSQPAAVSRPIANPDASSSCTATSGTAISVTWLPSTDTLSAPHSRPNPRGGAAGGAGAVVTTST